VRRLPMRHRVVTRTAEGMAAPEAPEAVPAAAQNAVPHDRFGHVVGTSGHVATGA